MKNINVWDIDPQHIIALQKFTGKKSEISRCKKDGQTMYRVFVREVGEILIEKDEYEELLELSGGKLYNIEAVPYFDFTPAEPEHP